MLCLLLPEIFFSERQMHSAGGEKDIFCVCVFHFATFLQANSEACGQQMFSIV